jgi:hypothetical protein
MNSCVARRSGVQRGEITNTVHAFAAKQECVGQSADQNPRIARKTGQSPNAAGNILT